MELRNEIHSILHLIFKKLPKMILINFRNQITIFLKSFLLKKKTINASLFFNKKRLIYRMHRKFSTRYYANRLIFKHVFLPEKSRQFSITRFVENFKTHPAHNFYRQVQLFLFNTLLSSQFFFFLKQTVFFF